MSFLTKGISAVLGGGDGGPAEASAADNVERQVDRLQSSTLLEDRRDAVRGLKALSKQFKLEVGTQGMDALINTVDRDRTDTEVVANGLEALLNVISADVKEGDSPSDTDLGVQFTEIFVKKQDNVSILLGLLEEYDFPVRWPTVKLLTSLLTNKSSRVQECVLESPGSVPRLMDLLSDSREIIRNDGLLLLTRLASRNTQIQRMVAFSGGMERLLEIIVEEGNSDGGIVVEDCILLLLNLVRSNSSNQSYFREASLVPRLAPFFEFGEAIADWSAQKVRNIGLMLRLVRAFVSPIQSQAQSTTTSQRAFAQCGIFSTLSQLMCAPNIDRSVTIEMMGTVAELLRGDPANQAIFAEISIAERPALLFIILALVEDKRPVDLRLAALYCFQCVLQHNEAAQRQIVATLMPSETPAPPQVGSVTAGQLLCRGLFSGDEVTMWCSAAALVACVETTAMKEELIRVQLSVGEGAPVALVHQAALLAARNDLPFRSRVGLLLLLSHWLWECPTAVGKLLSSPPCVQFLTSAVEEQPDSQEQTIMRGLAALLVGICLLARGVTASGEFTQESLLEIAQKRIRPENFTDALSAISQSELFMRAAQSYYPPAEVVFDFQYAQLFRQASDNVLRIVRGEMLIMSAPSSPRPERCSPDVQAPSTHILEHDAVVTSYKELIRDQDSQLISMREDLDAITKQRSKEQEERADLARQLKELQLSQSAGNDTVDGGVARQDRVNGDGDVIQIMAANASMSRQLQELTDSVTQLSRQNAQLQSQLRTLQTAAAAQSAADTNNVASQQQQQQQQAAAVQAAVQAGHVELERTRDLLRAAEEQLRHERQLSGSREEQVTSLFGRLQHSEQETAIARSEAMAAAEKSLDDDGDNLQAKCKRLEAQLRELAHRHGQVSDNQRALEGEHEDLLVLLAEQDSKISTLRARLTEHGEAMSESEGEDDDEEDDGSIESDEAEEEED